MHRAPQAEVELDVCKLCQFVWFDAGELNEMPARRADPVPAPLPQAAREAIAIEEARRLGEQALDDGPPATWQYLPALFGMPVECDTPSMSGHPAVTWTVALVILGTSLAGFAFGDSFIHQLALIPAEAARHGGLTLITSFFVHGGVLHLVGNLYFFLIFADNVEDFMGRWRFGALLLGASLAGDVAHVLADPRSTIPCIGASGGISGIIVFYAVQFPHARLGLFLRWFYRFRWVHFPAWAALACWIAFQLIGAAGQLAGMSQVSYLAHLGGAAIGFLAWGVMRLRRGP